MKRFLVAALLFMGLIGCKKTSELTPAQPTVMSAQVNGQSWHTVVEIRPPYAQVDDDQSYKPNRYVVFIQGGSATDLTSLGIKTFDITLNANYLPKIGRHYFNYSSSGPIGAPNQNANYLSASIQFEVLNTSVYHAEAVNGFLDITNVTDTYVGGTFEFTASTFLAPATGVPTQFTVEKGQFYAQIIGTGGQHVPWEGVQ